MQAMPDLASTQRRMSPNEAAVSVLLVDDNPAQLNSLASLVQQLRPNWQVAAQLASIDEAPKVLDHKNPSLCILDVLFRGTRSQAVIRELAESHPTICVSGQPQYAAEAFDSDVIDFVSKPVQAARFEQALKKAEAVLSSHAMPALSSAVPELHRGSTSLRILRGQDLISTPLDEVRYFQAQRKYTRVVLKDQEGLLRLGLSAVQQHVNPAMFWRIHRGLIINIGHMQAARRDEFGRLFVRINGRGERLIVSKPHEHMFRDGFC